jgi:DNA polymerase-3 subunit gamma/tau
MNANILPDAQAGGILVQFSATSEFSFKAAQKPEVREALDTALAQAGAPGVSVSIVREGVTGGADAAAQAQPAAAQVQAQQQATQEAPRFQPPVSQANSASQAQAQAQPQQQQQQRTAQSQQPAASEPRFQPPAQVLERQQRRQAQASAPAPEPADEVPLDVYDSFSPSDFGAYGQDPAEFAPAENLYSPPAAQPHAQAFDAQTGATPAANEPTQEDLNQALFAGFGDNVSFTSID